jgi:8-oxo-dGTP diphosphatase
MSFIPATLCYIQSQDKTLMLHRISAKEDLHYGKYNGLGGKIEPSESPEECVIREVREESGLQISEPKLHGIITFPKFDGKNDWLVFVFTADNFTGRLKQHTKEGKLEWIDKNELYELHLWEGDYIFMKWLEGDRFFSAKFRYKKGKLEKYRVNFY